MSNRGDDLYEGYYYVEDESVEAYSPVHIQDPRTLPNSQPPVVVSNTELLSTLHHLEQNWAGYENRLSTMESILEELAPRNSHRSRSHGRRRRGRFRQPTPRRLEYGETTPGANLPPGALISQGAFDARGAPLTVAIPTDQPGGSRRGTGNQSVNA